MNYYNEFEPQAAAWLRELIAEGLIPAGIVDTRSIEDVHPSDLAGFTQCHFFAGIGGWSLALQLAAWPADRNVWTGSCPCQPFSAAGAGVGFADERHLWPAFFHLIAQCRPAAIFGEQVASAAVGPWLDLVHADLEAVGYAFGSVAFPAAGVGAPHIRDRTYWVGYANESRLEGLGSGHQAKGGRIIAARSATEASEPVRLADSTGSGRREEHADDRRRDLGDRAQGLAAGSVHGIGAGGLGDANGIDSGRDGGHGAGTEAPGSGGRALDGHLRLGLDMAGGAGDPGPTNGHWRAADWLGCRDGKWRPVEPGTFPLAHGLPARVGRLRGYGNAIVPQAAAEFIRAAEEGRLMEAT